MTPNAIVAYLALFATVGFLFLLASLLLGRFLRSSAPGTVKLDTYECGEPSIGPGFLQFDLRFYVVALVFLIFEVEVAFFFPPATLFGKAIRAEKCGQAVLLQSDKTNIQAEATAPSNQVDSPVISPESAGTLALAAMLDLGIFFAVLLVGFAYVWNRGDLNWVRAVRHSAAAGESARLRLEGGPTT